MLAARAGLVLIIFSECSVLGEGDSRYTCKGVCCQVQAHESKFTVFQLPCSVILLPIAVTFYVTWWFIRFFDGFFSPIYDSLGVHVFGIFQSSFLFIANIGCCIFWACIYVHPILLVIR
jgi:hypothetical protein